MEKSSSVDANLSITKLSIFITRLKTLFMIICVNSFFYHNYVNGFSISTSTDKFGQIIVSAKPSVVPLVLGAGTERLATHLWFIIVLITLKKQSLYRPFAQ